MGWRKRGRGLSHGRARSVARFAPFRSRKAERLSYGRRLGFEPLEERRMLAVVTVTTLADTVDFNDGVTSLREAIFATNTVPGADTINFAPSLTAAGPATILLTEGELRITDALAIDGPGPGLLTIDASGNDPTPGVKNGDGSRVFDFQGGIGASVDASIRGLTLTGGDAADRGGAIFDIGNLLVDACVIRGNFAEGFGGGIYAIAGFGTEGFTFIKDSVVSQNGVSGTWAEGGGIAIGDDFHQNGTAVIENCQVIGNTAIGGSSSGGGIFAGGLDRFEILDSRISENLSEGSSAYGGGVSVDGTSAVGNVLVRDSEISGNLATGGQEVVPFGFGGWASGGGMYIVATGNVEITGNSVTGNRAVAISASAGGASIEDQEGTISFGENSWVDNHITNRFGTNTDLTYVWDLDGSDLKEYAINSPGDLLPGDFNLDGVVDAADYTVWRDRLAFAFPVVVEVKGQFVTGDPFYETWKSNFGRKMNVVENAGDEPIWDVSSAAASEESIFSGRVAGAADVAVAVTTLDDSVNFNDGVTSLREAIFATNLVPGADTIILASWPTAGVRQKFCCGKVS